MKKILFLVALAAPLLMGAAQPIVFDSPIQTPGYYDNSGTWRIDASGNATLSSITDQGLTNADVVTVGSGGLLTDSTYLPAGNFPALTGDVTTSAGSLATTLATVNSAPGTYGSAADSLTATVNGKGLVTSLSAQSIAIAASQITSGTLPVVRGGTGLASAASNSFLVGDGTSALVDMATLSDAVLVTDANASPSESTTLPNGITATTQTAGDSTAKLATDAFVSTAISNIGTVVNSFNTRTGAVTLTSSDVTTALGYTPVNKAGDTMTGNLNVDPSGTLAELLVQGDSSDGAGVVVKRGSAPNSALFYAVPSGTLSSNNPEWESGLFGNASDWELKSYDGSAFSEMLSVATGSGDVVASGSIDAGVNLQTAGTTRIDGSGNATLAAVTATTTQVFGGGTQSGIVTKIDGDNATAYSTTSYAAQDGLFIDNENIAGGNAAGILFGPKNSSGDSGAASIAAVETGSTSTDASTALAFQTRNSAGSDAEAMRISPTQHLLIGTTADDGTDALQVNGSANVSGLLTDTSGINFGGQTLSAYNTGSFTFTPSGCGATFPSVTATYTEVGNQVTVQIPYFVSSSSCTSAAAIELWTALPAAIQNTKDLSFLVEASSGSTFSTGMVTTPAASGAGWLYDSVALSSFPSGSTVGFGEDASQIPGATPMTYTLN